MRGNFLPRIVGEAYPLLRSYETRCRCHSAECEIRKLISVAKKSTAPEMLFGDCFFNVTGVRFFDLELLARWAYDSEIIAVYPVTSDTISNLRTRSRLHIVWKNTHPGSLDAKLKTTDAAAYELVTRGLFIDINSPDIPQ